MMEPSSPSSDSVFVDYQRGRCGSVSANELQDKADPVRDRQNVSFVDEIAHEFSNEEESSVFASNISMGSESNSSSGMEKLKRLKSRLKHEDLSKNELELKASLYFHICNPLKRWKVEKLVPYKLLLQVIKTIFLVTQVVLLAHVAANERAVFFFQTNFLFQQLLIKSYSTADAKPSNHFLVRTQQQILEEITYAVERYHNLPNITIGSFGYPPLNSSGEDEQQQRYFPPPPVKARLSQYRVAEFDPSFGKYHLDYNKETTEFQLVSENVSEVSVTDQLIANSMDITFSRQVHLELTFKVNSIWVSNRNIMSGHGPECFTFTNTMTYTSSRQYAGVEYYLDSDVEKINCQGDISSESSSNTIFLVFVTILDTVIIVLCIISICFTCHTYRRAYLLGKAMGDFYSIKLKIDLTWWERRSLFSVWSVFTFFSDVMLISGSFLKILLQFNILLHATGVRLLIGTALIVQAGALMRYFSFFKQLNALTRTLGAAYPELIKFLLCTSLLYFAFALCGQVVFGSYGELFGNFGNSVEILFALINGDSVWLVFRAFDSHDIAVYVYSRFYVYTFIFLFIYAVLNLFTSLVKTSYDESTVVDRATINEVRRFVFSGPLTSNGVALKDVTHVDKYVDPKLILCRRKERKKRQSIGDLD